MKHINWHHFFLKALFPALLFIFGSQVPVPVSGSGSAPQSHTVYLPLVLGNPANPQGVKVPPEPPAPHFTYTHDYYVQRAQAHLPNAPSPTANMTYHGGSVMRQFHAYAIYWDPNNNLPASFRTLVNRYFQDIGGTPFYNVNTQYSDGSGNIQNIADLGGTWLDTGNAYPHAGSGADPLTDGDIRAEVNRAITANSWPSGGLTNMYFVFTEQGIENCFNANSCTPGVPNGKPAYCAYHTYFDSNKIYANMPFVNSWGGCSGFATSPNGSTANDAEVSTASHEQMEAVTDPQLNAWYDSDLSGENGDKCNQSYGATTLAGNNLTGHGNPYILQLEWSNARFTANGNAANSGCASDFQPPNVSIVKSAPPNATAGTDMTYGIAVTNNGAPTAETPAVSDALPFGAAFQSITVPGGWTCATPPVGSGGTITCNKTNGFMNNGEAANFTIGVHIQPTVADGTTLSNTGAVAWDTAYRQNPQNTSDSRSTLIAASADLIVSKSALLDPVAAGTEETYTLSLINNGPSDAQNVTLADATPANTTFVSLSQITGPAFACVTPPSGGTGAVTCTLPTLTAGVAVRFTFVVHISPSAPDGLTLFNTATGSSSTSDPNGSNNSATTATAVIARADLSLIKTQTEDVVIADITQTYHLALTNLGPSDAQAVQLLDPTPAHTTFVSLTQDGGPAFVCTAPSSGGAGNVICTRPTLAVGDVADFTLVVLVSPVDVTEITNTASVASVTTDPNLSNNTAIVSADDSVYLYKQKVLADLAAWRGTLTDHEDGEEVDEALHHLLNSLNWNWWLDGNLLTPKNGEHVFSEEKEAVGKLLELGDDNDDDHHGDSPSSLSGPALDFVTRLTAADRALADVAITEAMGNVPVKHILRAQTELARGNADASAGKYEAAIEHYRQAWQYTQPDDDDDWED
jgi:uncharacterized repeat protein (TIGR01451 family)